MTTALLTPPTITRTPPLAPGPFRFTRAQYHRLGELGFFECKRVELIRGEILTMSPISWPHTVSQTATLEVLRKIFENRGWVSGQNPVVAEDSEPEPDVAVYPGNFREYFAHPRPADALLIVEVAVSSLVKDTTIKAEFYPKKASPTIGSSTWNI